MNQENKTEISASNKINYIIGVLVLIGVIGVAGFVILTSQPTSNNTSTVTDMKESMIKENESNVVDFNVSGENFKFTPNAMTVKKGEKVKITFKSTAGLHNLVIDEYNVKTVQVNTDGTTSVEFLADKAGSFEFYCSVANHKAQGMVGTFIVTE